MAAEKKSKLNREILAVVVLVAALLAALSLVSFNPRDRSLSTPSGSLSTHNWGGPAGAFLADLLLQTLGLAAFLLPIYLFIVSYGLFRDSYEGLRRTKFIGGLLLVWSAATFLSLVRMVDAGWQAGGVVGDFTAGRLIAFFSRVGAYVIVLPALLLAIAAVSQKSLLHLFERARKLADALRKSLAAALERANKSWRARQERGENKKTPEREYVPPPIVLKEESKEEPPKRAKKKLTPPPAQLDFPELSEGGYRLPPLDLLDVSDGEHVRLDKETLEANSLILQNKLADFGVQGEVVAVKPGPVITMYEFKPAAGVKVRRIVTLADDLSMALRAMSIRILAPIPGESVVGIEIPNPRREKVFLRQVIESELYQNADSKLTLALGRDISGLPFITDLARMPHLLVAGATGTGKSVSINAMILSMLFKATPQDLQFIMIDPKMLELSIYENLPHMIVPVVTEPKKAAAALFWAMDEMDRRYRLMREKGARNIDHYNRTLEKDAPDKHKVVDLNEAEAPPPEEIGGDLNEKKPLVHERLPRIVIIVDELADLMMSVGRDIEEYITRLAQKARAAGIHMILATQRPSVDVITGLIKANFPARISFQVTSRVDSRTILDSIGSERLLGDGDMLFLPPGTARLSRVHGAYVSDQEIRKVMDFINQQAKPHYRLDVFEAKKELDGGGGEEEYDEMYDQAVELVTETQQASISMIQRRLRVGYNRAARMVEQMERDGVVGPADGAKPREVYARKIEP